VGDFVEQALCQVINTTKIIFFMCLEKVRAMFSPEDWTQSEVQVRKIGLSTGVSGKSDLAAVGTDAQIANRPRLFFGQPGPFG
jgi:hypothetical protein